MTCCSKRTKKKIKKYSKKIIIPYDPTVPISVYREKINNEIIQCFACKDKFALRENKLSIHCSGCYNFFHCGIAGQCIGKNCTHIINTITKYESYCNECASIIINDTTCICNTCSKKSKTTI